MAERNTATFGTTAPIVSSSGVDTMFSSSLSGSSSSLGENQEEADEVPARTASISPAEAAYLQKKKLCPHESTLRNNYTSAMSLHQLTIHRRL